MTTNVDLLNFNDTIEHVTLSRGNGTELVNNERPSSVSHNRGRIPGMDFINDAGANPQNIAAVAVGRNSHPCDRCSKSFQNNSALMKHRLIHSEERRYVCHICKKGFKRQDHLVGHMNVHKAVKPFPCVIADCDRSYCDGRSLKRHLEHAHNLNNPEVHSSRGYVRVITGDSVISKPMNQCGDVVLTSSPVGSGTKVSTIEVGLLGITRDETGRKTVDAASDAGPTGIVEPVSASTAFVDSDKNNNNTVVGGKSGSTDLIISAQDTRLLGRNAGPTSFVGRRSPTPATLGPVVHGRSPSNASFVSSTGSVMESSLPSTVFMPGLVPDAGSRLKRDVMPHSGSEDSEETIAALELQPPPVTLQSTNGPSGFVQTASGFDNTQVSHLSQGYAHDRGRANQSTTPSVYSAQIIPGVNQSTTSTPTGIAHQHQLGTSLYKPGCDRPPPISASNIIPHQATSSALDTTSSIVQRIGNMPLAPSNTPVPYDSGFITQNVESKFDIIDHLAAVSMSKNLSSQHELFPTNQQQQQSSYEQHFNLPINNTQNGNNRTTLGYEVYKGVNSGNEDNTCTDGSSSYEPVAGVTISTLPLSSAALNIDISGCPPQQTTPYESPASKGRSDSTLSGSRSNQNSPKAPQPTCSQCGRKFVSIHALNGHMRQHTQSKKEPRSNVNIVTYPSPNAVETTKLLSMPNPRVVDQSVIATSQTQLVDPSQRNIQPRNIPTNHYDATTRNVSTNEMFLYQKQSLVAPSTANQTAHQSFAQQNHVQQHQPQSNQLSSQSGYFQPSHQPVFPNSQPYNTNSGIKLHPSPSYAELSTLTNPEPSSAGPFSPESGSNNPVDILLQLKAGAIQRQLESKPPPHNTTTHQWSMGELQQSHNSVPHTASIANSNFLATASSANVTTVPSVSYNLSQHSNTQQFQHQQHQHQHHDSQKQLYEQSAFKPLSATVGLPQCSSMVSAQAAMSDQTSHYSRSVSNVVAGFDNGQMDYLTTTRNGSVQSLTTLPTSNIQNDNVRNVPVAKLEAVMQSHQQQQESQVNTVLQHVSLQNYTSVNNQHAVYQQAPREQTYAYVQQNQHQQQLLMVVDNQVVNKETVICGTTTEQTRPPRLVGETHVRAQPTHGNSEHDQRREHMQVQTSAQVEQQYYVQQQQNLHHQQKPPEQQQQHLQGQSQQHQHPIYGSNISDQSLHRMTSEFPNPNQPQPITTQQDFVSTSQENHYFHHQQQHPQQKENLYVQRHQSDYHHNMAMMDQTSNVNTTSQNLNSNIPVPTVNNLHSAPVITGNNKQIYENQYTFNVIHNSNDIISTSSTEDNINSNYNNKSNSFMTGDNKNINTNCNSGDAGNLLLEVDLDNPTSLLLSADSSGYDSPIGYTVPANTPQQVATTMPAFLYQATDLVTQQQQQQQQLLGDEIVQQQQHVSELQQQGQGHQMTHYPQDQYKQQVQHTETNKEQSTLKVDTMRSQEQPQPQQHGSSIQEESRPLLSCDSAATAMARDVDMLINDGKLPINNLSPQQMVALGETVTAVGGTAFPTDPPGIERPISPLRGRGRPPGGSTVTETVVEKHACDQCTKTFQNNSALLKHKLIHSEERKFTCHLCNKGFKRQDHLAGHINVHKAVKPFPCVIDNCDRSYCDGRSLKRHLEHAHYLNNPEVHSSRGETDLHVLYVTKASKDKITWRVISMFTMLLNPFLVSLTTVIARIVMVGPSNGTWNMLIISTILKFTVVEVRLIYMSFM